MIEMSAFSWITCLAIGAVAGIMDAYEKITGKSALGLFKRRKKKE